MIGLRIPRKAQLQKLQRRELRGEFHLLPPPAGGHKSAARPLWGCKQAQHRYALRSSSSSSGACLFSASGGGAVVIVVVVVVVGGGGGCCWICGSSSIRGLWRSSAHHVSGWIGRVRKLGVAESSGLGMPGAILGVEYLARACSLFYICAGQGVGRWVEVGS